ncbi:MAG: addiction module antidote protein [Deferribacterales bacterium]
MRTYRTLDTLIQEKLATPENRGLYLDLAVDDYVETGDEAELLLAVRQVVQAGIGFAKLAEMTGLSRESLYKTLSGSGNPKLKTIKEILSALGYSLYFKKQSA